MLTAPRGFECDQKGYLLVSGILGRAEAQVRQRIENIAQRGRQAAYIAAVDHDAVAPEQRHKGHFGRKGGLERARRALVVLERGVGRGERLAGKDARAGPAPSKKGLISILLYNLTSPMYRSKSPRATFSDHASKLSVSSTCKYRPLASSCCCRSVAAYFFVGAAAVDQKPQGKPLAVRILVIAGQGSFWKPSAVKAAPAPAASSSASARMLCWAITQG